MIDPRQAVVDLLTREPGKWGSQDPGSLYGAFKQNPQDAMTGAMMGMTTPLKPSKLKGISTTDRGIMGDFVRIIEEGKGKQSLGQLGKDAQSIAQGLGLPTTVTNKTLANKFNQIVQSLDRYNIKPVRD